MAVWRGLHGVSLYLCIRKGLSCTSVPADTLFTHSPKIHVNQPNILTIQVSWSCLAVLHAMIFISRYFWISADTRDCACTAIVSGRQGVAPWLWSAFSLKTFCFTSWGVLIQAKRQQCVSWQLRGSSTTESEPSVLVPCPSHCNALLFSAGISSSYSGSCMTGTEALLSSAQKWAVGFLGAISDPSQTDQGLSFPLATSIVNTLICNNSWFFQWEREEE